MRTTETAPGAGRTIVVAADPVDVEPAEVRDVEPAALLAGVLAALRDEDLADVGPDAVLVSVRMMGLRIAGAVRVGRADAPSVAVTTRGVMTPGDALETPIVGATAPSAVAVLAEEPGSKTPVLVPSAWTDAVRASSAAMAPGEARGGMTPVGVPTARIDAASRTSGTAVRAVERGETMPELEQGMTAVARAATAGCPAADVVTAPGRESGALATSLAAAAAPVVGARASEGRARSADRVLPATLGAPRARLASAGPATTSGSHPVLAWRRGQMSPPPRRTWM